MNACGLLLHPDPSICYLGVISYHFMHSISLERLDVQMLEFLMCPGGMDIRKSW